MPVTASPLRYPGGKTKLYDYIENLIKINDLVGCTYVEPFAGGAGLALKLLFNGIVDEIILNDLDYAIFSFWNSLLNHEDQLCDFINNVPLNIEEWQNRKNIYNNQDRYSQIDIGLSAFYLNRTNVSGIIHGGVIGGASQNGNYKIDARFKREDLIRRVRNIAAYKEKIHIYNWDASAFVQNIIPNYDNCFIYFDPPYVKKGPWLYRNSFTVKDHEYLAELISTCNLKWIVTYDECDLIKQLYKDFAYETLSINYSAGRTKSGNEIVIFSSDILH